MPVVNSFCPACAKALPGEFQFCGFCGRKLPEILLQEASLPRKSERRDVTVLFADVSGFTSMCEKMDPEEVFVLMNRVFEGLGKAISEEDGHIDKYIGDNVMALFGAPVAHEDDPERACRAALGMQAFLNEFAVGLVAKTGVLLKMRIGINCGLVLAGGIGSAVKMEYSVLGDTVNLASRMESKAPAGGILIAEFVARRISGFELGPAQAMTVKGKTEPVTAFQLLGPAQQSGAAETAGRATFVGRHRELQEIRRIVRKSGRPRPVVSIVGETGIGKTRFAQEILCSLPHLTVIRGQGTAESSRRPFGFFRKLLYEMLPAWEGARAPRPETETPSLAFSPLRGASPEAGTQAPSNLFEQRERFFAVLESIDAGLRPFCPALWYLCAPGRLDVAAPDADPRVLRQSMEKGLEQLLDRIGTRRAKTVLFLDSFEAADSLSRELILRLAGRQGGAPLRMIMTERSIEHEYGPAIHTRRLEPLDTAGVLLMLQEQFRGREIAAEQQQAIVGKAGGMPLYVEEICGYVLRQLSLPGKAGESSVSGVILPPTLRSIMLSRLDRLEDRAREFICACAVQGAEFHALIGWESLSQEARPDLPALLERLQKQGLIAPVGALNSPRWTFTHPLFQESCYETLMLRDRKRIHAETSALFARTFGGEERVSPELLAFHDERAELWASAVRAEYRAGVRAETFGLNREALKWFVEASRNMKKEGGSPGADMEFLVYRGMARVATRLGEYPTAETAVSEMSRIASAPWHTAEAGRLMAGITLAQGRLAEAETSMQSALAGLEQFQEPAETVFEILQDAAEFQLKRGRPDEALVLAQTLRSRIPADLVRWQIRGDTLEGRIQYAKGRFPEAQALFQKALEKARQEPGLSEKAQASNNLGNVARDLGDYDGARAHFLDALAIWEKMEDAEWIAGTSNNLGNLGMSMGDFDLAAKHHADALNRWKSIGNVQGMALSQANLAFLALEKNEGERAIAAAEEALETIAKIGNVMMRALVLVVKGEGLLLTGALARARTIFDEVLREFDPAKTRLAHAGAQRGLGKICLADQRWVEAVGWLTSAEESFRALKRSQEVARTQMCLGMALFDQGKTAKAIALIQSSRDQFAAMKAERDLARANELLKTLPAGDLSRQS
jgi:adenylate cyclase